MLRLLSDANVDGDLIRGLRLRLPSLDLVRVQDVLVEGCSDPDILTSAAGDNRVLISNDRKTMINYVYQRVAAGMLVPGVIITHVDQVVGAAIDDILLIAQCMPEEEIADKVIVYLPFRG